MDANRRPSEESQVTPGMRTTEAVASSVPAAASPERSSVFLCLVREHGLFLAFTLVSITFQAFYVFSAKTVTPEQYPCAYDIEAHRSYFEDIYFGRGPAWDFFGNYLWNHFPTFYQVNAAVAHAAHWILGVQDSQRLLQVGWFLQVFVHIFGLWLLWKTLKLTLKTPWLALLGFALIASSPRIFFCAGIWNQDDYVFALGAACAYLFLRVARDGPKPHWLVLLSFAAAVGIAFKTTMLIPVAALLGALVLLPQKTLSLRGKGATIGLIVAVILAVNWPAWGTESGRKKLAWLTSGVKDYYRGPAGQSLGCVSLNCDDIAGAYFEPDLSILFLPKPITDPTTLRAASTSTAMYAYNFELYEYFQSPERTWLSILCIWSGSVLFGMFIVQLGKVSWGVARRRTQTSEDIILSLMAFGAMAGLLWFSLGLPLGWAPHPEYVLAGFPMALILAMRYYEGLQARPAWQRWLRIGAGVHLCANLIMVTHVMIFMLSVSGMNRP